MMGLLGNVAEVGRLRYRLMTSEYIKVFSELLDSTSDGIEVSYNAAGVLAHIASDGEAAWTITTPSREDVLGRMVSAVERWSLDAERNINYRSFEPILGLITCYHTPACQIWAVWALANLTKVS
jgi:Zyg-11 protein homolog